LVNPLALVPICEQELVDMVALNPGLHVVYDPTFLPESSVRVCYREFPYYVHLSPAFCQLAMRQVPRSPLTIQTQPYQEILSHPGWALHHTSPPASNRERKFARASCHFNALAMILWLVKGMTWKLHSHCTDS
ncbi:hypothetical protein T310_5072, partial [Rasamsonia emersonii CBS 393.64]